ncbi:MAG: thioesterase family protein [Bacillota bacterium]|nr:thioesterase family protein [Bacillota bacterium]
MTTRRVTWRDCDLLGHVNNAVYFTYFEEARTLWLERALGVPPSALSGGRRGEAAGGEAEEALPPMVLAKASCTYRSPARFGEELRIGVRLGEVRSSAFELEYEVEAADGRRVASGRTVQVFVDARSGRPRRLPPSFRQRLEAAGSAPQPPGSRPRSQRTSASASSTR